jgi:hypothetical protein
MKIDNQMTLGDVDAGYQAFVDKFKPKKTTDDCYTPEPVYKAVLDWVVNEYGIDPNNIVRPFWPGGDYLREEYPEGCTVVRRLDSQKAHGKVIFGTGYLVSDEAAQRVKTAEVKAAEHKVKAALQRVDTMGAKAAEVNNIWELSEREQRIIEQLNKQGGTHGRTEKDTGGLRQRQEAPHDTADPGGRAGDPEGRAQSRDPL